MTSMLPKYIYPETSYATTTRTSLDLSSSTSLIFVFPRLNVSIYKFELTTCCDYKRWGDVRRWKSSVKRVKQGPGPGHRLDIQARVSVGNKQPHAVVGCRKRWWVTSPLPPLCRCPISYSSNCARLTRGQEKRTTSGSGPGPRDALSK